MTGEGTSYNDQAYTLPLNSEKYGVGFRKESNLASALNEFFKTAYKDGAMLSIAEKYGIKDAIKAQ